jgi:hypothetical protein
MGEIRNVFKVLVGKPEDRRPFGRSKCRWDDNNRMYLRETGWEDVDWMHLSQDRDQRRTLVNTVMNLRFPSKAGKLLTS